ncbi:MAG: cupin domain-containing protein [Thermodesulfobacteriota bacterium]
MRERRRNRGAYALYEANLPPMDIGPPPHIDRNEDIGFYVLEGQFTFSFEESEIKAKTGDFVFMPRGLKHWLRSDSDKVGRMLVIASPAGFEKFYDATGTPVEDDSKMPLPPTNQELMILVQEAPNFGIEMFL